MAQKASRVTALEVTVEDRPGMLAKVMTEARDAGLEFRSVVAWTEQGKGVICGVPMDLQQALSVATGAPYQVQQVEMIWVEGDDERGALVGVAERIAAAGISIEAMHVSAVAGKFAGTIFLKPEDMDQAAKALGI